MTNIGLCPLFSLDLSLIWLQTSTLMKKYYDELKSLAVLLLLTARWWLVKNFWCARVLCGTLDDDKKEGPSSYLFPTTILSSSKRSVIWWHFTAVKKKLGYTATEKNAWIFTPTACSFMFVLWKYCRTKAMMDMSVAEIKKGAKKSHGFLFSKITGLWWSST